MAFPVTFYNFQKKQASTKRPEEGVEQTTFQCVLKSSVSVSSPQIELQGVGAGDLLKYNYCYIADFRRYYFITDWQTARNIWTATLECDVLATWKNQIGDSYQYVTRSHYLHDGTLFDDLYPVKSISETVRTTLSSPWSIAGGVYVLGVINPDNATMRQGAVAYYVMDNRSIAGLVKTLLRDPEKWAGSKDPFDDINLTAQFNPMQYITSCIYIPIADSGFNGTDLSADYTTTLPYGWWDVLIAPVDGLVNHAGYLKQRYCAKFYDVTLPSHPQISRGSYLSKSPYSEHTLSIPPFGEITIPTTELGASQKISYRIAVDAFTGMGRLDVFSNGNTLLASRSAKVGIEINLAHIARDYMSLGQNLINSGIDTAVALGSRNFVGGITSFAKSMIGTALAFKVPKFNSTGTNGSFLDYAIVPQIDSVFGILADEDLANKGRPCCQKLVQRSFPNFRICQDVQIDIEANDSDYQATSAELNKIKELMEGGYFYE